MNWNVLSGKTVEMMVDQLGKLTCFVREVKDGALYIQSKGREYILPVERVGMHRVVTSGEAKFLQVEVFMCKNSELSCKGVKLLKAVGSEPTTLDSMPCEQDPHKRESTGCEFARVGNLYDLPPDIQNKFLNGLHTGPGPLVALRSVEPISEEK